ncbi:MAG: outer membrane lipoprotein-sorting protein [Terriglobia bacterium]
MKTRIHFLYSALFLLCFSATAIQADPKGDQLVMQYLNQSSHHNGVFKMGVDYQEAGKEPIHLEFTWTRKSHQGLMSHLIKMEAPPSEKGKLLLVHEKPDGDLDYIAYRPNSALKKKVRVSGARNYKYKGFSISVQELIGGGLMQYDHQSEEKKVLDGIPCQIVENRIKPQFKSDSSYPRSLAYFREDNGMLQRWELFGNSDKLEKVIEAGELKKVQGNWTLMVARVDDLPKQGKLVLKVLDANYNQPISDELFNEEYLKQNSK